MLLALITLFEDGVSRRINMLRKLYVISRECRRFRLLKGVMAFAMLLVLPWSLACRSFQQSHHVALIRGEVEQRSSFPTKWNDLQEATASGNIELWAADYAQGYVRTRSVWIVRTEEGRAEAYEYLPEGGFYVDECFGPHRPEVLGQALPLAIKYADLLHKLKHQPQ